MASKKYIKDYELVETEDANGRVKKSVIYHGDYFTLDLDESQIRKTKRNFVLLTLAIILIHIGAGFVGNPGMYKFYIVVPYTSAFLPLMFMLMAVTRLPSEKRPYRNEEIGLSYERIKTTSLLYLIFMGIGLVGVVVFRLISIGQPGLGSDLIYFGLICVCLALDWMIYRKIRKIRIEISEKPAEVNSL